jgi:hypothetical protein
VSEPLPEPAMPTEAQYNLITKNLGIEPSPDRPYGRFADEIYYRRDIDAVIDAHNSPADASDCAVFGITASQWNRIVTGVLAYAAGRYKIMLPPTDAEIELLIDVADVSWRPRLRELMRGGMTFVEAVNLVASEEAVA